MKFDFGTVNKVHMIGIGGVSMSGIAKILHYFEVQVTGSTNENNKTIQDLIKSGISVGIGHNKNLIKDPDLVIYTAAINDTNEELIEAKRLNIPCMERGAFLGELTKRYSETICISGTHGKTTTTSMVSICFLEAGLEPTIQVGANLKQINGNYYIGNSQYFIIEACEYVEAFLHFYPKSEIILNVDNDHLDYFKTFDNVKLAFEKFAKLTPKDGKLVLNADDTECLKLANCTEAQIMTYGLKNSNANFIAKNISYDDNGFAEFDVYFENKYYMTVKLSVPGEHNVSNALACIALCHMYGLSKESMINGLKKFTGANRRFEYIGKCNGATIYDDYGHHPTEILATSKAMKMKKYNESWVIFQSHTYSRTFNLLDEFVEVLSAFDNIILSDIYAAREENIYNVSPQEIVDKLLKMGKNALYIGKYEDIAKYLKQHIKENDLVLTMGAGPVVEVAEMIVEK